MQTFVPYPSIKKIAESLDNKRLGKQRSESKIILQTLEKKRRSPNEKIGWANHPAVLMWEGFEDYLRLYSIGICQEWVKRGFKDTTLPFFLEGCHFDHVPARPAWWGDERVHESHRSKLIAKLPDHYESIFRGTEKDLDYFWPVRKGVRYE
jgi:hypothetical protein